MQADQPNNEIPEMHGVDFYRYHKSNNWFCTIEFVEVMRALNKLSPEEKLKLEVTKYIRFDNMERAARDYIRSHLYDAAQENNMIAFEINEQFTKIGNIRYQFTEDSLYLVWGLWSGSGDDTPMNFPVPFPVDYCGGGV